MSEEECAFDQTLVEIEWAVREMADETLRALAQELCDKLSRSATINWQHRVSSRQDGGDGRGTAGQVPLTTGQAAAGDRSIDRASRVARGHRGNGRRLMAEPPQVCAGVGIK